MKHGNIKVLFSLLLLLYINWMKGQNPNWQPPIAANYAQTSSVIAKITLNDIASNNVDDRIAFFSGNELRGLGKPVNAGNGTYLHFITLYSNFSLETMTIKVYHKVTNQVYEVVTPFAFKVNDIVGGVGFPFLIKIYENNNYPLGLLNVPPQTTMRTIPFKPINMDNYLIQPDSFPVEWSTLPNPNLISFFDGSVLHISGANGFVGQTALTVRATELSTASLESMHGTTERIQSTTQYAETTILCTVTPLWNAPKWLPKIPNQGILLGNQFTTEQLDQYENQYNGPAILYDYRPIITTSNPALPKPSWNLNKNFGSNMTVIARIDYTPKYQFLHRNDVLAAFVNNELRGVAVQDSLSGSYFLTIGGDSYSGDTIDLQFYSGTMKQVLKINQAFIYAPFKIIGQADAPFHIDFAPIVPIVPMAPVANGIATMPIQIRDATFIGTVTFEFTAKDPTYPTYLHDETNASYCVVQNVNDLLTLYQDADGDGLGNPNVFIKSCVSSAGYVTNDDDCDDTNAIDPSISISVIENSGTTPNDGNICSGAPVTLAASGGTSYEWNNGSSNATNLVSPLVTSTYTVTVTHVSGCKGAKSVTIQVEGTVVKNSANSGEGTLRNVLECLVEGGTVTYDQPLTNTTLLSASLLINKNATILGSTALRPEISIDFNNAASGIQISANKKLTLNYTDIKTINANGKNTFIGPGTVELSSFSRIRKQ